MTLVKFQPAPSPFRSLFDEFFNGSFNDFVPSNRFPALNVVESENGFRLEMAVPGFAKEDFNISVDKGVLTVSATTKTEKEENNDKYRRREFSMSSFERSFNLPETLDADNVKATYNNGVLHIDLVKALPETSPAKRIAVE